MSSDDDDYNAVQAFGRPVMRQNNLVDLEVSIVAKIPEHGDDVNKVSGNSALILSKSSFDSDSLHDNGAQGQGDINDIDLVDSDEDTNKSEMHNDFKECNDDKELTDSDNDGNNCDMREIFP